METRSTQQEILVMTGTSFSSRQWCEKDESNENQNRLSDKEQLQEALWNGLIREMIPEICERSADGKSLYLREIREAESFIALEMGDLGELSDPYYSIDPHNFGGSQFPN